MGWDVVILNSTEKIIRIEDLNEEKLVPVDFSSAFEEYFEKITKKENHWEISGVDFEITYYYNQELCSNIMLNLYGENAIYHLVILALQKGWQIFDTGLGKIIDLSHPENNGYANFQSYLQHVLKNQSE